MRRAQTDTVFYDLRMTKTLDDPARNGKFSTVISQIHDLLTPNLHNPFAT